MASARRRRHHPMNKYKPHEDFRIKDQPCMVPLLRWVDSENNICTIIPDPELDELFINSTPPSILVN